MLAGEVNFIALPVVAVLALVGGPLAFYRAGYGVSKLIFGSITVFVAALGVTGIIISVQHKTGLSDLPLAWLAVPALAVALWCILKSRGKEE